MQPDEMLVDIAFRALAQDERGCYMKLGLRRAQAISVVNCAVVLRGGNGGKPAIALGAVAPTIVRAEAAEQFLAGRVLDDAVIKQAVALVAQAAKPIGDVRATADYRGDMVQVLARRVLHQLKDGRERASWGDAPVLLVQKNRKISETLRFSDDGLECVVNGKRFVLDGAEAQHKTLLRLLREDCGLIGTKEGCAEGECGACTVLLDGKAVMACLVPAPRAHGASVVTVEGVNGSERINGWGHAGVDDGAGGADVVNGSERINGEAEANSQFSLHPLQQAFVDFGAVQCGYCTPGFIMSGVALLAEKLNPTEAQMKESISGNLCRCTGYYKILQALRAAAESRALRDVDRSHAA
jgi:carbon-monoxide dehydrogenase medium subunit